MALATTLPGSDHVCASNVYGDGIANTLQFGSCQLPANRAIRLLAFGVSVTDGNPLSLGDCDVWVGYNGSEETWSRIEIGNGRNPSCDVTSDSTDSDLDTAGETCLRKNPSPTELSDDGSTKFEISLGDGDGTCPDATTMDALNVMLIYQEKRW